MIEEWYRQSDRALVYFPHAFQQLYFQLENKNGFRGQKTELSFNRSNLISWVMKGGIPKLSLNGVHAEFSELAEQENREIKKAHIANQEVTQQHHYIDSSATPREPPTALRKTPMKTISMSGLRRKSDANSLEDGSPPMTSRGGHKTFPGSEKSKRDSLEVS